MSIQKIDEVVFAYCFAVLELFLSFLERTHALIGIGLSALVVVTVHTFLGRWGDLILFIVVALPASVAMGKMIVDCLVLSKRR